MTVLGLVSAPMAAPPTPPMTAPRPTLPVTDPMAAPAPAPSRPPETARSPGVVPQAANVSAIAMPADAAERFKVNFANICSLSVEGSRYNGRVHLGFKRVLDLSGADPIQRRLVLNPLQPVEQPPHRGGRKAFGLKHELLAQTRAI